MNKTYKIQKFAESWECTVEVNTEFVILEMCLSLDGEVYNTNSAMLEMIQFFDGGYERLEINNGNVLMTFLQQLGREIYFLLMDLHGNYSLKRLLKEFEIREGWSKMDGSWGIKIIDVEAPIIEHDDFEIEEVSNG